MCCERGIFPVLSTACMELMRCVRLCETLFYACCGVFIVERFCNALAKNVPPARFLNAFRLKHGRSASCLKALPRTPCFCASSYSLYPPPAAVVLVTSNPLNRAGQIKKRHPDGYLFLMELMRGVRLCETLVYACCGVFIVERFCNALAKNVPPARFLNARLRIPSTARVKYKKGIH